MFDSLTLAPEGAYGARPTGWPLALILDNRDSFVHNLAHHVHALGMWPQVHRSDAITLDAIAALRPAALLLSPGPGHPRDAGVCLEAVRRFSGQLPILGVCLGHQAIVEAFGGCVEPSGAPRHGRTSRVNHDGVGAFAGLPQPLELGRYHALIARAPLPDALIACAHTEDGLIMACRHHTHATFGVQFHPESVLSAHGLALMARWARDGGLPVTLASADDALMGRARELTL